MKKNINTNKKTTTATRNSFPFFQFLNQKEQRIELGIFFSILLVIFVLLEYFYPYFFNTPDTGNYIASAVNGLHNGYRPMGFSKFMRWINDINPSYYFLYFVQFWLTALTSLFFIFTVKYIFFSQLTKNIIATISYYALAFFVLTSPSLIFCTKYIMAEAYFNLNTTLFLTTAIWMLHRKNWMILLLHILSLYLLMTTRYIGMVYPVISFFICLLMFRKEKLFTLTLAISAVLMGVLAYKNTKEQMKKAFNVNTFSAFGGWTSANNVLCLMPEMKQIDPSEIKDLKARYVHQEMIKIPDSIFHNDNLIGTYYIWAREHSLKNVLFKYIDEYQTPYYRAWVLLGSYMDAYGSYWKKKMPVEFAKRYYLLNFQHVFSHFRIGQDENFQPDQTMIDFFRLSKENDYVEKYPTFFLQIDPLRKIGHYVLWILTGLALIIWGWKRKWFSVEQHKTLAIIVLFCVAYIGASVIGHPINNFRYFLPIYIPNLFFVMGIFAVFLGSFLVKKTSDKKS